MKKPDEEQEKKLYETPRVLASYEKDDLEDAIGIDAEVEGQATPEGGGGGCGCGCGCSAP
jgi:hypothetical protein